MCYYGREESRYIPEARHSSFQGRVLYMQPALFVGFAVITISRHARTHFVSIIDQSGMRCFVVNIIYNIARVLSLSKSY